MAGKRVVIAGMGFGGLRVAKVAACYCKKNVGRSLFSLK